jgi:hypothetical protein
MIETRGPTATFTFGACMRCGWVGPLTPAGGMATRIERDSLFRLPGATIHDHACGCEPTASTQREKDSNI